MSPATVVVQYVKVRNSKYHDFLGNNTPYTETVGSGTAKVLRDGKVFDVDWKRPTACDGTIFTTADGAPMNFAKGQVWVVFARHDDEPIDDELATAAGDGRRDLSGSSGSSGSSGRRATHDHHPCPRGGVGGSRHRPLFPHPAAGSREQTHHRPARWPVRPRRLPVRQDHDDVRSGPRPERLGEARAQVHLAAHQRYSLGTAQRVRDRAAASQGTTVTRSRRAAHGAGDGGDLEERAAQFGVILTDPEVSMTTQTRGGLRRRLDSTAPGTPAWRRDGRPDV